MAAALSLLVDDLANSSTPLKWNTPVSELIREDFVLPDEYATTHVTLEDILSHRTGMPRHDLSYGGRISTPRDVVRNLRNLPMTAEIRTTWQYCNMMYVTAGYVVDTLTGMWLGDVLRDRIWKPLSMSSTFFSLNDAKDAVATKNETLALGYYWKNSTQQYIPEEWGDEKSSEGAGGVISSVLDYTKWLRTMIDKAPPISAEGHAALRAARSIVSPIEALPLPNTGPTSYALGWMVGTYRGKTLMYHGGSEIGFGALMLYMPWESWGLSMMGNTLSTSNLAQQILLYALMDNLLDTPLEERIDWKGIYDNMTAKQEKDQKNARRNLYPDAPKKPIPQILSLEEYTGSYFSSGYGAFNVTLAEPDKEMPYQNLPEKVLRVDKSDRALPFVVDFEHVSGEYLVAYGSLLKTDDSTQLMVATKAEFQLNQAGKVARMGIAIEPLMGEEMIWFQKDGE